jgi:TrmH family RNA methyltransferase
MEPLTSRHNPKIKELLALRERRDRDRSKLFLIEGYRELLRATEAQVPLQSIFYCPELFLGSNEPALLKASGARLYACDEKLFRLISYRDRPDGLIAVAPHLQTGFERLRNPSLLIVAEHIEKPGNLGTLLRSADGAGADGVIVCDRCTDMHNPNVVRASVGTLFTVPTIEASSEATLDYLRQNSIRIIAATDKASDLYTDTDLTGPCAFIVGTEQLGLTPLWLDAASARVRIPMLGRADSLNVATAASLLLYEAVRQRALRR